VTAILEPKSSVQALNAQAKALLTEDWLLGLEVSRQAIALARDENDRFGLAHGLRHSGMFLVRFGRYEEAFLPLEEALNLSQELASSNLQMACLRSLGALYFKSERFEMALKLLQQAIDLSRQTTDMTEEGHSIFALAGLHASMSQFETARDLYAQAAHLFHQVEFRWGEIASLNNLGEMLNSLDQTNQAMTYYSQAHSLAMQSDVITSRWIARGGIGVCQGKQGLFPEAIKSLEPVFAAAIERGDYELQLSCGPDLGFALCQTGQVSRGQALLLQTLTLAETQESNREKARIHRLLATHHEIQDNLRASIEHFKAHLHFKALFDSQRASHQSKLIAAQFELERLQYETREEVLLSFGVVLEYRDDETHGHTERVVKNTMRFGKALGLNRNDLEALRQGAYLHDIGKLAISDKLLHKPGRFTSEERLQMQEHVLIGHQLALKIPAVLPKALEVILSHHERWDGTGYNQGLSGTDIPFLARVFSIVDVFDALVSVRPYKTAWSEQEAFAEILAQAGQQFDPELVQLFLKTFSA
jgi:HD-GYP domain-containing protein (c-di-GMP phosphodiesterase class II)/Tfp pilus assembly protein PilF